MMVGSLQEMNDDLKYVTDYTINGKCTGCGQCCGRFLPLSGSEITAIKGYVKEHDIKPCLHKPPTAEPAMDFSCPFLDTGKHDKKCTIYEKRPDICRTFVCNQKIEDIEARKRLFSQNRIATDMWEEFFPGKERSINDWINEKVQSS